jgi:hypothetical protein
MLGIWRSETYLVVVRKLAMNYYQQHPQPAPPVNSPPQDYMHFQNVSPEMLNFGLHAGQDLLSKQRERWMPGVSGFWLSLKYYFAVSNNYVLKKISMVLYPLGNKAWARLPADEFERGEVSEQVTSLTLIC